MGRVLAALLVLVALTGCSTATAPAEGLDDAGLAELKQYASDLNWAFTGLPDSERPAPLAATVVSPENWTTAYVTCMNAEGFDNYESFGDGSFTVGDGSFTDPPDAEVIAQYRCNLAIEVEGQYDGMMNVDQLAYVYDYYQEVLVPCLETRGYHVQDPPTREEFVRTWGGFHPYYSVAPNEQHQFIADSRVPQLCPPMPAGVADPGYATLWER
jgi:hypothetical protein